MSGAVGAIIPGAEPFELAPPGARDAVLLLHGFADTPQVMRYLGERLAARGWVAAAPLLTGHGRTLAAFDATGADDWIASARDALADLRARYDRVALVGLSMGGAIAALLAAGDADVPALVLLAPYVDAPAWLRFTARVPPFLLPHWLSSGDQRSVHDPAARARTLGYGTGSLRLYGQLVALADRARVALPRVTSPTLLVQSREDNRVAPSVAERAVAALGARTKRLEWIDGCGHVITIDYARERVAGLVAGWIEDHLRSRIEIEG